MSEDSNKTDILNGDILKDEVLSCIKQLKNGSSCGIDNRVCNEMIKGNANIFAKPLVILFNRIFTSNRFPEEWTCNTITPIFKSGNINTPSNFRGIAVAGSLCKLFNKILAKRLEDYMSLNELYSNNQLGFRKKLRTEDNVFILHSAINKYIYAKNRSRNSKLYISFVDFQKFFDSINRNMLLYKLIKYGITGKMYYIIKDMYTNCQYRVKNSNGVSKTIINSSIGLKQGDCTSPILSNIFQNDIHDIFNEKCDQIML